LLAVLHLVAADAVVPQVVDFAPEALKCLFFLETWLSFLQQERIKQITGKFAGQEIKVERV